MEFQTAFNKKPFKGEKLDPMSQVETAGYISQEKRIAGMMNCGIHLRSVAQDAYDFLSEPLDFEPDPTRTYGFEMTDALMMAKEIKRKGKKSSQTAQNGSGEVKTEPKVENPAQ